MTTPECKDCKAAEGKEYYGIFTLTCRECRGRMLMSEPCKVIRQYNAKYLEYYGDLPDWKQPPSCDCKVICKRQEKVRKKPEPDYD